MSIVDFRGHAAACLIAGVLLSPVTVAGSDQTDCMTTARSQRELNECGASHLKAADDELNRVYQAIVGRYRNDRAFLDKLRTAQRAWVAFRDAELEARFPAENKQSRYGSVYPRCANLFLAERTRERIRQLRQWLDGTEEGNVCAGSVRYRGAP